MEVFRIHVRGTPRETIDYNTRDISFDNGSHQYQRTWIKPQIKYSVSTEGNKKYMMYIINFFKKHKGMLDTFYCDLFGCNDLKVYRFASPSLSIDWYYSLAQKRVGGKIDLDLMLVEEEGLNDDYIATDNYQNEGI